MRHRIIIHDEIKTLEDAAYLLREIVKQIGQGYTSGRGAPTWDFEAVEGSDSSETKACETNGVEDEENTDEGESGAPEGTQEATGDIES